MTWRLHLLHFPLRFLVIFTCFRGCFLYCFVLYGLLSWVLSYFLFLGYLTPSCVHFLNYLKEGEETFCSLNVFFS